MDKLLIIPEIELRNGVCTECIKGEIRAKKFYSDIANAPSELARLWRRENAKSLCIYDDDSFNGDKRNTKLIIDTASSVDITFKLIYNFTEPDECDYFLNNGIYRIGIPYANLKEHEELTAVLSRHSSTRISICTSSPDINELNEIADFMCAREIQRLVYEIAADRVLNRESLFIDLVRIFGSRKFKITLRGGVGTASQLWELQNYARQGIDSVIIGRPLYENSFPCQKIWRLIESEVENVRPGIGKI